MEDEGKADEGIKDEDQIEQLRKIQELKRQFDEEMVYALKTNKLDRALELKGEIEERISRVQELLTPPGTFTKEQIEALESRGFVIVRLTGQSIASEREKGHKFQTTWHKKYPDFENKRSRLTEIAFNPEPDKFFLPGSNNMSLNGQELMVEEYSKELQEELKTKGIKGVKAIIGEASDYVELVFNYKGKYGHMFGEQYGYNYTRTRTLIESSVANVGDLDPDDGLNVNDWDADNGLRNLWVAPLVVPDENR